MKKIYLQFVSQRDGHPLSGITVQLQRTEGEARLQLASLTTNRNGYVIFKAPLDNGRHALTANGEVIFDDDIRKLHNITDAGLLQFSLDVKGIEPSGPIDLTSATWHQEPLGVDDINIIPDVFPDLGTAVFGSGPCARNIPSDQVPQIYDLYEIEKTGEQILTCVEEAEGEPFAITQGFLHHFQTQWDYLGLSLGHLVKSISLLPCEKVTVATSDFQMRYRASTSEQRDQIEGQTSSLTSNQSVSEVMNAASSSLGVDVGVAVQAGQSTGLSGSMFGVSAAVRAIMGITSSIGVNFNTSRFTANASRKVTQAIQAAAQAWRRNTSTSVYEVTESQKHFASTRTICNNNHCHTLNVFFREVHENYKVSTFYRGKQEVVLVPQEVRTFTPELALCARHVLEGALLDASLETCFDSLQRSVNAPDPDDAGGDTTSPTSSREVRISVRIGNNGLHKNAKMQLRIKMKNGTLRTVDFTPGTRWKRNSSSTVTLSIAQIDVAEIAEIGLRNNSGSAVRIDSITFSFIMDDGSGILDVATGSMGKLRGKTESFLRSTFVAPADDEAEDPLAALDAQAQSQHDAMCSKALVTHLNCHKHYYNQMLWLSEDPNARLCRYEKIICGKVSLADLVVPVPLAVAGCALAFERLDTEYIEATDDTAEDKRLVTLSSPGVHADAALGQCTTCEEIDPDRYWDWSKTPCNCSGDTTPPAPSPTGLPDTWFSENADAISELLDTSSIGEGTSNSLVAAFGAELAKSLFKAATSGGSKQAATLLTKLIEELGKADGKEKKPKKKTG